MAPAGKKLIQMASIGGDTERALLAAIVASSDDAIVSKTLEGRVTSWNAGAVRMFGYTADEMIGQPIMRIIPTELHAEEETILRKLRRGEHVRHYETVRVARDGRRLDISLTVSPLRDAAGQIVGASKVARDVTERRQAEELQRLLIEELNHRVKNTLATIQAVASQSLQLAESPRDFVTGFSGRIQALARAHALLVETRFQGSDVADIVREQILGVSDDGRISSVGPHLTLDSQVAVHLGMVLHELATNARKFGALSVPDGRLDVCWEVFSNGKRRFVFDWRERGGPEVSAPKRRGFGSRLIERTLRAHGGEVGLRYGADGVSCTIELPLADEPRPTIGTHPPMQTDSGFERRAAPQSPPLPVGRILVVEDEPLVSMDIEETLTAAGCEVVGPAGTFDCARSLIADAQFDAALLDVNLAGSPVDELAAALAKKDVPFAFVTGYGRDALPRAFRGAALVGKPFSPGQLMDVAKALLNRPSADSGVVPLRTAAAGREPILQSR